MLKARFQAWVKPVGGLLKVRCIKTGLSSWPLAGPGGAVDKHPGLYEPLHGFVPGFFHGEKHTFISIISSIIPIIHTTYNKRLVYLNLNY